MIRRAPDHAGDERGSMLVEMVMTVGLLGLLLSTVYGAIASLTNATEGTSARLVNLDEARVIMAVTTKDLRTATAPQSGASAFTSAAPNDVIFYANLNNPNAAASLVHITVNSSTELVETVTPATNGAGQPCSTWPCTYDPGTTKTRFVGRYVDTSTAPVFTYLDTAGGSLGAGGALTPSQLVQVRSVRVSLAVRKQTSLKIGTTWLENTVGLPNVAFQQAT